LVGFIVLIALTIGIILHELIHGITWAKYTKDGFKSIRFEYFEILDSHCHCKEPLLVKHYIIEDYASYCLGVFPALLSFITGNVFLLIFGIFFTMAAFGDFMIIFMLLKENKKSCIGSSFRSWLLYLQRT
jgi:hypothetical protein